MRKIILGTLTLLCCLNLSGPALGQSGEGQEVRRRGGFIGLGIGAAGYWPDTDRLSSAFTAIEDYYRDQGYYIPGHKDFGPSPIQTYSVRVQPKSPFGLIFDAAFNGGDDQVDVLAATLLFNFTQLRGPQPYIGVGVTDVSFEFTRHYDVQISGAPGDPYYSTLDEITAVGRKTGASFIGGVQFESLHLLFAVQAGYWLIPELSDDFGTGVVTTVDLSSFVIAAQLMVTLP